VFAVVALIVRLTVDLAARDRAYATRSALEAALLARFAAMPAELSLPDALQRVRTTFGMTSAALVRQPTSATAARTVVASVGPRSDAPPSIRITAGPGLALEAHGPVLFAEDRRLLERLAAAAARAWEGQHLAAQADALAETDRGRSALLAAVGHDLRAPLTGLKAAVSSLRQDDIAWPDDEEQQLLATIEDSSDRLTDLIANLLDMSRLEVGGITAPHYEHETNYLRVYLAQLRRKLEVEPAHPRRLMTEPGMGYRFEP
jgi:signal transduction histidine kinase